MTLIQYLLMLATDIGTTTVLGCYLIRLQEGF